MSNTPLEVVNAEAAAEDVDATPEGKPQHRRYSLPGIMSEIREIKWLSPKQILLSLLAVVTIGGFLVVFVHGLDKLLSGVTINIYESVQSLPGWVSVVLVVLQLLSAGAAGFFALKHPSPGDTLASIFGGEMVAQGSGLSPRERALEARMGVSVGLFFLFSFLLGLAL